MDDQPSGHAMLSPVLLHDDLTALSQQQLDDALVELCAHMNAAEYRLLEFVGEYDSRGLEGALGVRSLAHWLNYRCGIDLGAAREKVRVARALRELPLVRQAFAAGTVSYSKVRAVTRVATPANEGLLLGYAKAATASQLEQIVRGYRRMERLSDPDTVLRQQRERGLRWWIDEDGSFVIEGRFPPEEGALILRALEAVQARTYREEGPDAAADTECPAAARRGDALLRLVEAGMANEDGVLSGGERTLVVVHVPAPTQEPEAALPGPDLPELEHGPFIHPETARRLACDASVVAHVEDSDGATLSIGRRSRSVPPWMHRALRRRDGGCRFPGCTNSRHVDAHHVHHWADGGETALDNLILLCRHHHRLVHEHGFRCEPDGAGDFRFARPDGTALPNAIEPEGGVWTDVAELNERRGIDIDRDTCAGGWDGSPIDYSEAVARIQQASNAPRPAAGP